MKTTIDRTPRGWIPSIALALLASSSAYAQIQIFEFTGTVEDSHPWIDFESYGAILPGWEVQAGDPIVGSFKVDTERSSHLLPGTGSPDAPAWPVNNRFYFGSVSDFSVKVNGREIVNREHKPGDTITIGGFEDLQENWEFPLIGEMGDSIAFATPWGGVQLADGFDGSEDFMLGVSLNLTDSFGELFDRAEYPSSIDIEAFDFPKGFIYEWENSSQQGRQGILYSIDSLRLVDTVPRPFIANGPDSLLVQQGDDVSLSVEFREGRRAILQWSLNGVELDGAKRSPLRLEDIQPSQSGTYMISAWNNVQTNTAIARVQVDANRHLLKPVPLTGWNADVIVERGGDPSKHTAFDGGLGLWFMEGYLGHVAGFPASESFTSSTESGALYRLQPADENNVLLLSNGGTLPFTDQPLPENPSGRLTLKNPRSFTSLAIAAASGSGGGNGEIMLHFADGSTSSAYPLKADDWWTRPDRESPTAIAGLYRLYGRSGEHRPQSSSNYGFGLYETLIDLSASGLDGKVLTEIEFTMASAFTTGIFAVSGQSVEIRIGAHVTWPETDSEFLEIATSPNGVWSGLEEAVESINGKRTGLAPDGTLPRYQRSFPVELEDDLQVHYDFVNDGRNRLGRNNSMELSKAEVSDGVLFLNGLYGGGPPGDGFVAKARIGRFSYRNFTVAVDFKPEDMESPGKRVILMGGPSYRWFGFEPRGSRLVMTFNNGRASHEFRDTELTVGAWHRLICSVNTREGVIRTQLNGQALEDFLLDEDFRFEVIGTNREVSDKVFTFTNYSSGNAFHGHADNLMVFRRALSAGEMQILHEALSPSPLIYGEGPNSKIQANLHVAWKSNFTRFEIESASSLSGPWLPVEEPPTTIADVNFVPMDFQQEMKIYRLSRSE